MSGMVIDSCIVVKWILPEIDSPKAQQLIARAESGGEELVVLDLVFPEVANAIWKRLHRGMITLEEARSLLKALHHLPVRVEPAARFINAAFDITATYDRSFYDALFIALMQERGIAGVTSDEPLFNMTREAFPQLALLTCNTHIGGLVEGGGRFAGRCGGITIYWLQWRDPGPRAGAKRACSDWRNAGMTQKRVFVKKLCNLRQR